MNELKEEETIKKILDYAKKNYDDQQQSNISLAIDLARKSNNLEPLINKINYEKYENMHFVCNIFLREVYYQSHSIKIEDYPLDYIFMHAGMFKLNVKISKEMRKKLESKELSVSDVFKLVHDNGYSNNPDMNSADPYKYVNTSKDFQDYPLFSFMSSANFRKLGRALGGNNLQIAINEYIKFFENLETMDKNGSDVVSRLANYCQGRKESFENMIIDSIYDKTDIIMRVNEDGSYTEFVPDTLETLQIQIKNEIDFSYINAKNLKNYCQRLILLKADQKEFSKKADWTVIEQLIESDTEGRNIFTFFSSDAIINILTPPYENFKYACRMLKLFNKMMLKLPDYLKDNTVRSFKQKFTNSYKNTNDMEKSSLDAFFEAFDFLKTFTNDYQEFYEKYYDFLYNINPESLKRNITNELAEPELNFFMTIVNCMRYRYLDEELVSKYFNITDKNTFDELFDIDLNSINIHENFYEKRIVIEKLGVEYTRRFMREIGITDIDDEIFEFLRSNAAKIDFYSNNYEEFKKNLLTFIMRTNFDDYEYDYEYPNYDYSFFPDSIKKDYPDFFIDDTAPKDLKESFYAGKTKNEYLRNNPQYYKYFANVNLKIIFETDKHLLSIVLNYLPNEKFLELFHRFGNYVEFLKDSSFDSKKDNPEKYIMDKLVLELKEKYFIDDDTLEVLMKEHPEFCPSHNMSDELKYVFTNHESQDNTLGFKWLKNHPEYKQYPNKYIGFFLPVGIYGQCYYNFIKEYSEAKAFEIGLKFHDRIDSYIINRNLELFKAWYEKTGGRFVPTYYIAKGVPSNYIDKFLCNAKKWHALLKLTESDVNTNSVDNYQIRDLLTLAIVCGAFDNDDYNFNVLSKLLMKVPNHRDTIPDIDEYFLPDLVNILEQEGFKVDKDTNVLEQIYRKNADETYTLTITPQKYPKSIMLLHNLIAMDDEKYLTIERIHSKFGGLEPTYNQDFATFFLKNIEEFLTLNLEIKQNNADVYFDDEENNEFDEEAAIDYPSAVQHKFAKIKAFFANVPLTMEKVKTYISNSEMDYTEGNEFFGDTVGKIGYSEERTKILEQIYNIGKKRVFSSIPRISGKSDDYSFEILRMDDPLGLVIGNLSDCCQQLGGAAETSMEHSMVSNNGRVFVIKDKNNRIIAQSWVWRNKNTICFDNIEIPDRVFKREDGTNYAKVVYNIYLQAAKEFIKIEEETYLDLYKKHLITKEQYDVLRLSNVTVGLGYNDIASYIESNSERLIQTVRPIEEASPVLHDDELYTSDSETQYLLSYNSDAEMLKNNNNIPDNLLLYSDDFSVKTKLNNVELLHLMTLKKLTALAADDDDGETDIYYEEDDEEANKYLNDNTKKLISANFVIVFTDDGTLKIDALYYNPAVDKTTLLLQIYLAIGQIKNNLEIDISNLDEKEQQIIEEALKSENLIKEKRGITNGK